MGPHRARGAGFWCRCEPEPLQPQSYRLEKRRASKKIGTLVAKRPAPCKMGRQYCRSKGKEIGPESYADSALPTPTAGKYRLPKPITNAQLPPFTFCGFAIVQPSVFSPQMTHGQTHAAQACSGAKSRLPVVGSTLLRAFFEFGRTCCRGWWLRVAGQQRLQLDAERRGVVGREPVHRSRIGARDVDDGFFAQAELVE